METAEGIAERRLGAVRARSARRLFADLLKNRK